MATASRVVRARIAAAGSSALGILAAALVVFHLVSTAALAIVMVEVRGGRAEAQTTELMRALANSICGRLPPRLRASCPLHNQAELAGLR